MVIAETDEATFTGFHFLYHEVPMKTNLGQDFTLKLEAIGGVYDNGLDVRVSKRSYNFTSMNNLLILASVLHY